MGKIRSLICALIIACLSITTCITSLAPLSMMSEQTAQNYLNSSHTLITTQFSETDYLKCLAVFSEFSKNHKFIVLNYQNDAGIGLNVYTYSVFGKPQKDLSIPPLTFLGTTIIDSSTINKVLSAQFVQYMGYGNYAPNCIGALPEIKGVAAFSVKRLENQPHWGAVSKVVGLTDGEFSELVNLIAEKTNIAQSSLVNNASGGSTQPGLIYYFSLGSFLVLGLVLSLLLVMTSLFKLKQLGVYLMLGWSKKDIIRSFFGSVLVQLLLVIPLSTIFSLLVFSGFSLNLTYMAYIGLTMIPPVIAGLIAYSLAALVYLNVKPIDAISNRYSKRAFYLTVMVCLTLCVSTTFYGAQYIDGPLAEYKNLMETSAAWNSYAQDSIFEHLTIGKRYFTGNIPQVGPHLYEWYKDNEHHKGIYLVHTECYTSDVLKDNGFAGTSVKPFWYMNASPSYLKKIGISLSPKDLDAAEAGKRLYLLPESMKTDQPIMEKNLFPKKSDLSGLIATTFTKAQHPQCEMKLYPDQRLFVWNTDHSLPSYSNRVVITVVTSNNMIPFESESLIASGLQNSYIKVTPQAAKELLPNNQTHLKKTPYDAHFLKIGQYIEGMQKSLEQLFILFGSVLAILILTILIMIMCIINIVNQMKLKEIAVKHVLGFSIRTIYRREIIFINLLYLIGIVRAFLIPSYTALLLCLFLLMLSNLTIYYTARKKCASLVLETLSKE